MPRCRPDCRSPAEVAHRPMRSRVPARQPHRLCWTPAREFFPGAAGGHRRGAAAKSISKPTSSTTTPPAGRSSRRWRARRGAASPCACWSMVSAPATFADSLMPATARRRRAKSMIYRPELAPLPLRRHRLRRLHRKLAVIDGRVAFVGGINIIDDMHTPPDHRRRASTTRCASKGPLRRPIHASMRAPVATGGLGAASQRRPPASRTRLLPATRRRGDHARGLRRARQPAPSARHRGCLPRRHRAAPDRNPHRQRLLPARPALPPRLARRRRARRARDRPAAGPGRIRAAALRHAGALRQRCWTRGVRIFEYHEASCTPRWR